MEGYKSEEPVKHETSSLLAKMSDTNSSISSSSSVDKSMNNISTGWYLLFRLLRYLAVASLSLVAFVQILPKPEKTNFFSGFLIEILTCFLFATALVLTLVECDFDAVYKIFPSMDNWIARGFSYIIVGAVVGLLQSSYYANEAKVNFDGILQLSGYIIATLIRIAGFSLCIAGLIYFIAGLLCLKSFKAKMDDELNASRSSDHAIV